MGQKHSKASSFQLFIEGCLDTYPIGEFAFSNKEINHCSKYPVNRCFPTSKRYLCLRIMLSYLERPGDRKENRRLITGLLKRNAFNYSPLHWTMYHTDILSSLLVFVAQPSLIFSLNHEE